MKKLLLVITVIFVQYVSYGQTNKKDSSKVSFYKAYDALKNMLEGKDSLNYEKAVFITENAYHNNYFEYNDFKHLIDLHVEIINDYAEDVREHYKEKYKRLRRFEQQMFGFNTTNWAIFKYITDTAFIIINKDTYHRKPYTYTYQDPYGSNKWENTQVLFLLKSNEMQGNCYSLAVLFKIFADRLKSDARLTITPHHIYIQNRNERGDFYNVELASKSFPGDGTIQTFTYTTSTSIKRGMAQRMLNDKQAVALNLIYLAKSYQHKYNDNTGDFLLQCADLAYKYDTLSLNALLLKAEITENRLLASMKENKVTKLSKVRTNPQTKILLTSYENQLSDLYKFGYREIPKDIERFILAKIQHREDGSIIKDKTPNPFASIKAKQRYATLSNGMFDEIHEAVDSIQYYNALLNTKTKKIIRLLPIETNDNYKVDPVVFALSVDPVVDKYPNISPYAYCAWNPVKLVDPNGESSTNFEDGDGNLISHVEDGSNAVFKLNGTNHTNQSFQFAGFSDQKGTNNINVQGAIAGAQDYAINNYTQCNQAVNFVGKSFESALNATGATAEGIGNVTGNKCADPIGNGLKASNGVKEIDINSINDAKSSAHAGDLVVGYTKGHVTSMTTQDFDITRYDKEGNSSVFKYKGGMIVNVNGGARPRSEYKGLGPNNKNSYQEANQYVHVSTFFSLKRDSQIYFGTSK